MVVVRNYSWTWGKDAATDKVPMKVVVAVEKCCKVDRKIENICDNKLTLKPSNLQTSLADERMFSRQITAGKKLFMNLVVCDNGRRVKKVRWKSGLCEGRGYTHNSLPFILVMVIDVAKPSCDTFRELESIVTQHRSRPTCPIHTFAPSPTKPFLPLYLPERILNDVIVPASNLWQLVLYFHHHYLCGTVAPQVPIISLNPCQLVLDSLTMVRNLHMYPRDELYTSRRSPLYLLLSEK